MGILEESEDIGGVMNIGVPSWLLGVSPSCNAPKLSKNMKSFDESISRFVRNRFLINFLIIV